MGELVVAAFLWINYCSKVQYPVGQGFGLAVCKRLMDTKKSSTTFESDPAEAQRLLFCCQQPKCLA
jgi:light-regulated signal transduction histidine kinase (bacteriophytochrome)